FPLSPISFLLIPFLTILFRKLYVLSTSACSSPINFCPSHTRYIYSISQSLCIIQLCLNRSHQFLSISYPLHLFYFAITMYYTTVPEPIPPISVHIIPVTSILFRNHYVLSNCAFINPTNF